VNDWGKPTEIVDLTGVRHVRFGEVLPDLDLTKLATDDLHALRCALECEEQRRNEYWKDADLNAAPQVASITHSPSDPVATSAGPAAAAPQDEWIETGAQCNYTGQTRFPACSPNCRCLRNARNRDSCPQCKSYLLSGNGAVCDTCNYGVNQLAGLADLS
jgi:hypothetical protein